MWIKRIFPDSPEFQHVQLLRERYIGVNPAGESGFETLERKRDLASLHFAYMDGNRIVGAFRATPMGKQLTLAEQLMDIRPYFRNPGETFDANRLVLDNRYRGGSHMNEFLLRSADWLMEHSRFRHICALCRSRLTSIYIGIGGTLLEEGIPGNTGESYRSYSLVSLELETVYHTIRRRKDNGYLFQRTG